MGLGAKIKEALHSDHHGQTTDDVKAPGAYPDDEPSKRHSDGKEYIAPHGSRVTKKDNTGMWTQNEVVCLTPRHADTFCTGVDSTSATGHSENLTGYSATPRNKLHRDTDGYLPNQDYSQPTHGHHSQDSGVGLGHQTSEKDRTSQGAYWGDLPSEGHHGHGMTDEVPDRTYRGQDYTGAGRSDHNPRVADQAVGGGVYNSVTGAGSQDHSGSHGKHHASGGAVHDPLTSSTKGTSIPSGDLYNQKADHHGHGFPTSRNDHTGDGLAGTGAASGAGAAAGYGANEYAHRGRDNARHNPTHDPAVTRDTHAPGIPHSSMLDPEQGVPTSASHQNRQAPEATSSSQFSPDNTSTGAPNTAAAGGLGKDHYGPAHEGAKVMHTCQHCGKDNDISQYFRKEAVYRLGS